MLLESILFCKMATPEIMTSCALKTTISCKMAIPENNASGCMRIIAWNRFLNLHSFRVDLTFVFPEYVVFYLLFSGSILFLSI